MGALEFEPATMRDGKKAFTIEINSLVDIAQKMLSKRASFTTNLQKDEEKGAFKEAEKVEPEQQEQQGEHIAEP